MRAARAFWRSASPAARFAVMVLAAWLAAGLVAAALAGPPQPLSLAHALEAPSLAHGFGTDEQGRDVAVELFRGAWTSVLVSWSTVLLSAIAGVALGATASFFGGRADRAMVRVVEIVQAFPGILLAILLLFVAGGGSVWTVVLALSVTGWATYARLVRAAVLVERRREYVEAARALGLSPWRVLWRHVVPNSLSAVTVHATHHVGATIVAEATLSFLGLGQSGRSSWGQLMEQGATYFLLSPHLAIIPGLVLAVVVVATTVVGEALRHRNQAGDTPRQARHEE